MLRQIAFEEPRPPRRLDRGHPGGAGDGRPQGDGQGARPSATPRRRSWPTTCAASWRTSRSGPGGPRRPERCGSGRGGTKDWSPPRSLCWLSLFVLVASSFLIWQQKEQKEAAYQAEANERKRADGNMCLAFQALHDIYRDVSGKWMVDYVEKEDWQRQFLGQMLAFYQQFIQENGSNPMVERELATATEKSGPSTTGWERRRKRKRLFKRGSA